MQVIDVNAVFQEYYDAYADEIRQYCEYRLRNNPEYAEDCVQETFKVLLEMLNKNVEFKYVRAFLRKTASNFVNQKYREIENSYKRIVSIDEDNIEISYEINFFGKVSEEEIVEMKDDILSRLSDKEKTLFMETCCSYVDSYKTTCELAAKYSCSETAIRQRIFVLRTKIREIAKELTKDM